MNVKRDPKDPTAQILAKLGWELADPQQPGVYVNTTAAHKAAWRRVFDNGSNAIHSAHKAAYSGVFGNDSNAVESAEAPSILPAEE